MIIKMLIGFSFPLLIDFFTCFLSLRRIQKGTGPSGLPVVTLFIYGIFIFNAKFLDLYVRILVFFLCILVHVFIVFLIPYIFRMMKNKKVVKNV